MATVFFSQIHISGVEKAYAHKTIEMHLLHGMTPAQ